ncbi:TonB-dependent receptor plug domain-containing protein [bacterium]|nr:TonB-dependent receptor plug domain-containing protein [bacterium]
MKITGTAVLVLLGFTACEVQAQSTPAAGQDTVLQVLKPQFQNDAAYSISGDELLRIPERTVARWLSVQPGVVSTENGFHVRGGRSDQLTWMVDGVDISDSHTGAGMIHIIPAAVERVWLQPGGQGAAQGGRLSGVVGIRTKTGGSAYHFSAEAVSDAVWALKNHDGAYEILGIEGLHSFGYDNYTITASGPVIPGSDRIRFFVAGERRFENSPATRFQGFQQDSLRVTSWTHYPYGSDLYYQRIDDGLSTVVRDTAWLAMDIPPGRVPGGDYRRNTLNANLVFDVNPLTVQAGFNYSDHRTTNQSALPSQLLTVGESDSRTVKPREYMGYLRLTHTVDPTLFYTLQAGHTVKTLEYGPRGLDWDFSSDNFMLGDSGHYDEMFSSWSDPALHNGLLDRDYGYGNFYMSFTGDWAIPHYLIDNDLPGGTIAPDGQYHRSSERKWSFRFDLEKDLDSIHRFSFGGRYSCSVLRSYTIDIDNYYLAKQSYDKDRTARTEFDFWNGLTTGYGYDVYGNEIDNDQTVSTKRGLNAAAEVNMHNGPLVPRHISFYVNDRIELNDLVINAGVRYEHMRPARYSLADINYVRRDTVGTLVNGNFHDSAVYAFFLPRITLSFPVTDQAVVTAHYGKYVQQPNLRYIDDGLTSLSYLKLGHPDYSRWDTWNNVNLEPERSTEYSAGLTMRLQKNASFRLQAYYRNQRDLTAIRPVYQTGGTYSVLYFFLNEDFAVSKGVTAELQLRRTHRFQARLQYTFSGTRGSGSSAELAFSGADKRLFESGSPVPVFPLNFDRRHAVTAHMDLRTRAGDGPAILNVHPFENMGLTLLGTAHSGSPWTRLMPEDYLGGSSSPRFIAYPNSARMPWVFRVDARLEKRFMAGPLQAVVFLEGLNIFDFKSYTAVFPETGSPHSDGWLQTDQGQGYTRWLGSNADDYARWYLATITGCGSFGYQQPRQLRLGMRVEY